MSTDDPEQNWIEGQKLEKEMDRLKKKEGKLSGSELQQCRANIKAKRLKLLGIASALIMKSPQFSHINSVTTIMWRKCFYDYISTQRSKSKQPEGLATYKKTLSESIQFYNYVIEKLEEKLKSSGPNSNDSQRSSLGQSVDSVPSLSPAPISPCSLCLHRLYISLGDLCRYTGGLSSPPDFSSSEDAYIASIKHLPISGNSYNQLGVIHQLKGTYLNALFYYALATNVPEKFETAANNFKRCWQSSVKKNVQKVNTGRYILSRFITFAGRFVCTNEEDSYDSTVDVEETELKEFFSRAVRELMFSEGVLTKVLTLSIHVLSCDEDRFGNFFRNFLLQMAVGVNNSVSKIVKVKEGKNLNPTARKSKIIKFLPTFWVALWYFKGCEEGCRGEERVKGFEEEDWNVLCTLFNGLKSLDLHQGSGISKTYVKELFELRAYEPLAAWKEAQLAMHAVKPCEDDEANTRRVKSVLEFADWAVQKGFVSKDEAGDYAYNPGGAGARGSQPRFVYTAESKMEVENGGETEIVTEMVKLGEEGEAGEEGEDEDEDEEEHIVFKPDNDDVGGGEGTGGGGGRGEDEGDVESFGANDDDDDDTRTTGNLNFNNEEEIAGVPLIVPSIGGSVPPPPGFSPVAPPPGLFKPPNTNTSSSVSTLPLPPPPLPSLPPPASSPLPSPLPPNPFHPATKNPFHIPENGLKRDFNNLDLDNTENNAAATRGPNKRKEIPNTKNPFVAKGIW
ncbi:hypothetical protein TrVE_jg1441 [Triparma verrucosa]|uniref:Uncharacterized protein n=1 Tax=Triparma verrucosa TaxID=1606542 RepID=A0A9W7F8H4_9STRA|nr:hypothetical protein TrVE_jg1441 [Triparma verrucosa]